MQVITFSRESYYVWERAPALFGLFRSVRCGGCVENERFGCRFGCLTRSSALLPRERHTSCRESTVSRAACRCLHRPCQKRKANFRSGFAFSSECRAEAPKPSRMHIYIPSDRSAKRWVSSLFAPECLPALCPAPPQHGVSGIFAAYEREERECEEQKKKQQQQQKR